MATNQEKQRAANEHHHLRYVHGELARTELALRFLCKDIDAVEVRDAVFRAITALGEAQRFMRAPPRGTSAPTS